MLPLLRTISVGGVLLATTILALALSPPGDSRRHIASLPAPARGPLIDRGEHPEWRQFLILAAVRRADAVGHLRDLPDTPVRLPEIPYIEPADIVPRFPNWPSTDAKGDPKLAGLNFDRRDPDPDDVTGSSGATLPMDIGEASSTELPVLPAEERPPVIGLPERGETPAGIGVVKESRPAIVRHSRTRPAAPVEARAVRKVEAPIPFNLLQALFDSLLSRPPEQVNKTAHAPVTHRQRAAKPQPSRAVRSVAK
jgi:hypothetical protein